MSTKLTSPFFIAIIFFSACTKSGDGNNNNSNNNDNNTRNNGGTTTPASYLIHTNISSTYNSSGVLNTKLEYTFNYDKPNNTIIVYEHDSLQTNNDFKDTVTYKLSGDSITVQHKTVSFSETYYLNHEHTYPDSLIILNSGTKIVYYYINTFDANGKILSSKQTGTVYSNGATTSATNLNTEFTWQNGNQIKSSNSSLVYSRTYNEDTLAAQPDPILIAYNPMQNAQASKNILKTESITYLFNNSVLSGVCTYDDKQRLIKETTINSLDGSTTIGIATYY